MGKLTLQTATLFFLCSPFAIAQDSPDPLKQKIEAEFTRERAQKGHFGFTMGSQLRQYQSTSLQQQIKPFNTNQTQESLPRLQSAGVNQINFSLQSIQKNVNQFHFPNLNHSFSQISLQSALSIVDMKALNQFISQHLLTYQAIEQQWTPHLNSLGHMIEQNFGSIMDIPQLIESVATYIEENDLISQLEHNIDHFENVNWSDISLNQFIHQQNLQILLDQMAEQFNLTLISAENFLYSTANSLDASLQHSLSQNLASFAQQGFDFKNNQFKFQDPNQPNDHFSFTPNLTGSQASASFTSGTSNTLQFQANAGNYISVGGQATLHTQNAIDGLEGELQSTLDSFIHLVTQGANQEISLDEFLSQTESLFKGVSSNALSTVLFHLENNLETDFYLTLNLQAISDSFEGSGSYLFIDIILETLGHDVGSLTLQKHHIKELVRMAMEGNHAQIGEFILEEVAGFDVEVITYELARDVANRYLSEHFTGNMIALQHAISGNGCLIQNENTFFASMKIKEWKGGRIIATGSYNHNSVNNSPILHDQGHLHLRTQLLSHSVGLAYVPKIWTHPKSKTRIDGIVQIEGLFVQAKAASLLTKTELLSSKGKDTVELYRVPLEEIPEAQKMYAIPFPSIGANLQQPIVSGLSANGYVLIYPGLAQKGSLNTIAQSIAPRYQCGVSLIFNLQPQPSKKPTF